MSSACRNRTRDPGTRHPAQTLARSFYDAAAEAGTVTGLASIWVAGRRSQGPAWSAPRVCS
jgi:hypothetical protein